jgi:PPP family 3-phenylpropionic acid transporter
MTPRLGLAVRLATLHAALSTVSGIQTPLWPVFLAWRGLDPFQIGLVLSAAYIVKIVSNPIAGNISDRLGDRRLPLIVLAVIALLAYALYAVVPGFLPILAVTLVAAGAFTALSPLGDNLTLLAIAGQRIHYGHVRVWGSLAFMLFSYLASYLLIDEPPLLIVWAMLAGLAFAVFACWRLPRVRGERMAAGGRGMGTLLRSPVFLLFLGAVALDQSSNTALYGFSTLHWRAGGLSGSEIGALWAEMVAAEAIFFSFGHRIAARLGPRWLLVLGGAGGVVRWIVTASTVDPVLLASVQWMHCLTFTASHLAAMYFISRSIPIELSGRAQALYSSIALGLNFGLFLPLVGKLYSLIGGSQTFLVMAAMSAGGLGLSIVLLRRWSGGPAIDPPAALASR